MLLDIIVCMKYTRVVTTGRWHLEKVLMFQIEVAVQPLEIYISNVKEKTKILRKEAESLILFEWNRLLKHFQAITNVYRCIYPPNLYHMWYYL